MQDQINRIDAALTAVEAALGAFASELQELQGRLAAVMAHLQAPRVVRVVNADGVQVVTLTADADGSGLVTICDRHGLPAVTIGASATGGSIRIGDASSQPVAAVWGEAGRGRLLLLDAAGQASVLV